MLLGLLIAATILLAFANGANDNFKGVATLLGSGTVGFRRTLTWATLTTLGGSFTAVVLAGELLHKFSGKGLVSDSLAASPEYAGAVALGAALSVLLATRVGMPVSTTHALLGSLLGAGLASGEPISMARLGGGFVLPLLATPLLALASTCALYPLLRYARRRSGVTTETCICVNDHVVEIVPAGNSTAALQRVAALNIKIGDSTSCRDRYCGRILGVEAGTTLDWLHIGSAGLVGFSRGLNDTPKIAALLLLAPHLPPAIGTIMVGVAIACGGILFGRQVAHTMSRRITAMNHGQGFTANLITGLIALVASGFGMPVSTTHVSCGTLFGIGVVTGKGNWGIIGKIVASWGLTLPCGAALGAASMWCIRWL